MNNEDLGSMSEKIVAAQRAMQSGLQQLGELNDQVLALMAKNNTPAEAAPAVDTAADPAVQ